MKEKILIKPTDTEITKKEKHISVQVIEPSNPLKVISKPIPSLKTAEKVVHKIVHMHPSEKVVHKVVHTSPLVPKTIRTDLDVRKQVDIIKEVGRKDMRPEVEVDIKAKSGETFKDRLNIFAVNFEKDANIDNAPSLNKLNKVGVTVADSNVTSKIEKVVGMQNTDSQRAVETSETKVESEKGAEKMDIS